MNTEKKSGNFFKSLLTKKIFPLILLLIFMVIVFSIWSRLVGANFLKIESLRNILQNLVLSGFLALGAGCLMLSGNMDLSQSTTGCMGGIILGWAIAVLGFPWWAAMLLALVICIGIGAFNAFIITHFHFPAFIATLGMASVVRGLMQFWSSVGSGKNNARNIPFSNSVMKTLGTGTILGVPISVIIVIVLFIIYGIIIAKTTLGTKIIILGGNPVAANLAGIKATGIIYFLFMNAGFMGCMAGMFSAARLQQSSLQALGTNQFTGLTAAILGGISFGGGEGGMGGCFVGLLILSTFRIGMDCCQMNPNWVTVFNGLLLLIALCFDFINQARRRRVV